MQVHAVMLNANLINIDNCLDKLLLLQSGKLFQNACCVSMVERLQNECGVGMFEEKKKMISAV